MDKIQCKLKINNESNLVILQGLINNDIEINFNDDVDFTRLIETLTKLIDDSKRIEFENSEIITDEKLILIIQTISGIIDKYNEAISLDDIDVENDKDEDTDLPF